MSSTMMRLRCEVLPLAFRLAAPLLLSACASMSYRPVDVKIESKPAGASIYVDGAPTGKTPNTVALSNMTDKHVEIDHPDYSPFHTPLSAYTKFNQKTLLNFIWFWGAFIDMAAGASRVPLPLMQVDLTTSKAPSDYDRLAFCRIPEVQPPAEGGRLVFYSWEARGAERTRVVSPLSGLKVYIDGRKIETLDATEVLSEVLPAGAHVIEVRGKKSGLESAPFTIASGKTSYAGLRFVEAGRQVVSDYSTRVFYDSKLETELPEKDAIRFVYFLLKKKGQ